MNETDFWLAVVGVLIKKLKFPMDTAHELVMKWHEEAFWGKFD